MSAVLMDNTRLTVRSGSKHRNTLELYLKCNTHGQKPDLNILRVPTVKS